MQYNNDSCDDTRAAGNKNSTESKVEIKEEIESKGLITNEHIDVAQIHNNNNDDDYLSYENFKLKNEEIDLKFECNDNSDQSTYGCEKVDVGEQISSDKLYVNSANKQIFKCQHCTYETGYKSCLTRHIKSHNNIKGFKCTFCSKAFTSKINLDKHLFKNHNCRNVGEKLYNCDQCSCEYLRKQDLLQHKIKHGIPILKCSQCTFETYHKSNLYTHVKIHKKIKDFKCIYCPKEFTQKNQLNRHLFTIHKCRDVIKKLYNCNQCSYKCLGKNELLRHKIKHGITDGIPIFKCHQCPFETYHKNNLITHIKVVHKNIKKFKCTYCSKEFTRKYHLENHLLRIHTCRDVSKKLYSCDHCSSSI